LKPVFFEVKTDRMTTGHALVAIPPDPNDREYDTKAMSALTARKRKFVIAMLQQGVNPKAAKQAAAAAGYVPEYGHQLMRDASILAALREEATKRMAGAALTGVNVMLEIAQTPGHKDQFRAARELAAINGFTAEQRIVVEHISEDSKQQIRQIREMAAQLGMDPKQLIQAAGIIDAEFEEVKAPEVDTSDW
jgi:hypothetical protein